MARRNETRDKRLSLQLNPPHKIDGFKKLETLLCEHMLEGFVGPLSRSCVLRRLECAHDIARRYYRSLTTWAEFQARDLPDVSHDPGEFASYFNGKSAEIKHHAEALLALLRNSHFPPAISSVIGATTQLYLHPAGHASERMLERSLVVRLAELVKAIELPAEAAEQLKKKKGKQAVRAECIQAVLHMWLEIGGAAFKFQRAGSAGGACGPFEEFSGKVLDAFNIKRSGLEAFVREAEKLLKKMPESQIDRLKNQYRVTHQ